MAMSSYESCRAESRPSPRCAHGRAAIAALYAATITALVALWSLVPASPALAYVDPSVMTYTIQAVAGLAVALSAVIGVVFRRTRRKLYQLFNIDENAHKIFEGDVSAIDPSAPDAEARLARARDTAASLADACDEQVSDKPHRMRRRKRFAFALVMCVFMAFIVFIAPALEIFGSNGDSLVFGLGVVWWVPVAFCLGFAIIAALLVSTLRGRPFYVAVMVLFALTVAAYVQSLFMNGGMMPADGGFIGWTDWFFVQKMIVSGIVWIAIVAACVVICFKWAHTSLKATTAIACVIMIMQLVGVISVGVEASKTAVDEQSKPYVTQDALLTVSPKSNVIVFVLDTYDTFILEEVRKEDPHYLENFKDFTYFRNSAGTMIPTTNAIPFMMTALKPIPGQDLGEYRATKYERSTFLNDVHDLGYSIGAYSDSLMMDFNNPADRAIASETLNVHPINGAPLDIWQTFLCMEQCALYREMPWVLKPAFWYYTSDLNNRMIADSGTGNMGDSLYELDDAAILKMVREQGLKATDEGETGAFRFIHLFGPHFPYNVDENGNAVPTNQSNRERQAKGSMKVVFEYMDQLKKLGLYDQATIIVTADHGVWFLTDDPPRSPVSPIMLVKPSKAETDEGERERAVISDMPVSHDDLHPTIIGAMGGDSGKYGSTFFEISDPNRIRYYDSTTTAGDLGQRFVEYEIDGNIFNMSNWKKTGNVWLGA